jgi:glycosyltransferase involved in cell wall biosynthesis
VNGAENFDHVVFSLRRRPFPFGLFLMDLGSPQQQNVRVFAYGHYGLPLGIGLFHSFWIVARRIRRVIREQGLQPDVVHAHKLAFEGIAGWLLARALGVPLFISIRGEVEQKIFRFKPTYRALMRRIVYRAAGIFYVSAWYAEALERYTGVDPTRTYLLPNLVDETSVCDKASETSLSFLTVLNLNIWRKKGLDRLLPAFADAVARMPKLRLSIVGTGTLQSIIEVRKLIDRLGVQEAVRLEGAMPNAGVRERMSKAMALVLPSHNETFGMVYVEALFAGVPILYSKGTGIDGFIDGLQVGVCVDPKNVSDITRGLVELAERNTQYREAVSAAANELHTRFGRKNVLGRYETAIQSSLKLNQVRASSSSLSQRAQERQNFQ